MTKKWIIEPKFKEDESFLQQQWKRNKIFQNIRQKLDDIFSFRSLIVAIHDDRLEEECKSIFKIQSNMREKCLDWLIEKKTLILMLNDNCCKNNNSTKIIDKPT